MEISEVVAPDYGHDTLCEVLPAVAAHLGGPMIDGHRVHDAFDLPDAAAYVLVLVDGFGYLSLRTALAELGYLATVFGDARQIRAGLPSTTATSLTSLATGAPPGQHGIVGYSFRADDTQIMNALSWAGGPTNYDEFQPIPTWFERLSGAGLRVTTVSLGRFQDSGLTHAGLRGGEFVATPEDYGARIAQVRKLAEPGTLVYCYQRELDHVGHAHGVGSEQWHYTLGELDEFLGELRAALDPSICLIVTGDHGMVDVPTAHRIVIEDHTSLGMGLDQVGGEGRFRQLYTDRSSEVCQRWNRELGSRGVAVRKEAAIEAGWFGDTTAAAFGRLGDVLVAMVDDWAVLTRQVSGEFSLVGMHGSATAVESIVPLIVDMGENE